MAKDSESFAIKSVADLFHLIQSICIKLNSKILAVHLTLDTVYCELLWLVFMFDKSFESSFCLSGGQRMRPLIMNHYG